MVTYGIWYIYQIYGMRYRMRSMTYLVVRTNLQTALKPKRVKPKRTETLRYFPAGGSSCARNIRHFNIDATNKRLFPIEQKKKPRRRDTFV